MPLTRRRPRITNSIVRSMRSYTSKPSPKLLHPTRADGSRLRWNFKELCRENTFWYSHWCENMRNFPERVYIAVDALGLINRARSPEPVQLRGFNQAGVLEFIKWWDEQTDPVAAVRSVWERPRRRPRRRQRLRGMRSQDVLNSLQSGVAIPNEGEIPQWGTVRISNTTDYTVEWVPVDLNSTST